VNKFLNFHTPQSTRSPEQNYGKGWEGGLFIKYRLFKITFALLFNCSVLLQHDFGACCILSDNFHFMCNNSKH
jgi:hypothetical protein